jgi:hypothetical protein
MNEQHIDQSVHDRARSCRGVGELATQKLQRRLCRVALARRDDEHWREKREKWVGDGAIMVVRRTAEMCRSASPGQHDFTGRVAGLHLRDSAPLSRGTSRFTRDDMRRTRGQ